MNTVHMNTSLSSIPSPPANVIALRSQLRARFPGAHAAPAADPRLIATGIPCLDTAGVARGALTEVVGGLPSCGVALLIHALLERAGTVREVTALVDGSDAFDPWSAAPQALERTLWVRCTNPLQAVKAADLLLRDGNVPLVLLDLQMHPPREAARIPAHAWHRLRALAEKSGAALCVFTPCELVSCARARILLDHAFTLEDLHRPRHELVAGLEAHTQRHARAATRGEPLAMAMAN
jgi:hypothetical protein